LKYRLLPKTISKKNERLYFAFTGRFGMYIGNRHSEPVIGKSYNPKLIWRHVMDDERKSFVPFATGDAEVRQEYQGYLDVAYAHESNGQSIGSAAEFASARATAQHPDFASDGLSRGWDYAQLVWKTTVLDRTVRRVTAYADLKYFFPQGLLQDHIEEYNSWENSPEGKPRKVVNGIAALVDYEHSWHAPIARRTLWLANPRVSLKYETGYRSPFKYSTVRLEAGVHVLELPLTLWMQRGYGSDLAQYYKQVSSYGLELKMGGF
jgi:hypothetical protein